VPETKRWRPAHRVRSAKSHSSWSSTNTADGRRRHLEDVIEELVGEITDESDPVEEEDDVEQTIERGLEPVPTEHR